VVAAVHPAPELRLIGGASLENDNEVGIAPERGVDGQ